MRLMIGNSRSAAIPWTYWGVTAVSSMITPAALAVARPLAAASRASTATSSRSPKRPALIAFPSLSLLADGHPKGKSHRLIVGSEESTDQRGPALPGTPGRNHDPVHGQPSSTAMTFFAVALA